jgi:aryl-alcohol dehydrogenase-like predicted oxidoreductase
MNGEGLSSFSPPLTLFLVASDGFFSSLYGDSEVVIGKWFKKTGKRDDIFLASKFGHLLDANGNVISIDSSAKHCKEALAKSVERLGVNHIDLYYAHRVNPQTPIEETVRAMAELKE